VIGFIETEKVLFSLTMVHVTMKLVDMTSRYGNSGFFFLLLLSICLFDVSISEISTCKPLPIQVCSKLIEEVYQLTVAHKNDDLGFLMSEKKSHEIKEPELSWYLCIILLDLLWNRGEQLLFLA
jgi:hypothetical protein